MIKEPTYFLETVIIWGIPFMSYFVGIIIRKYALPRQNSPPLFQQILLGIPVSLVGVSPLIATLHDTLISDKANFLFFIGIIMEHGMLVNETVTKHLNKLRRTE